VDTAIHSTWSNGLGSASLGSNLQDATLYTTSGLSFPLYTQVNNSLPGACQAVQRAARSLSEVARVRGGQDAIPARPAWATRPPLATVIQARSRGPG
jgi:hypothetical protein